MADGSVTMYLGKGDEHVGQRRCEVERVCGTLEKSMNILVMVEVSSL